MAITNYTNTKVHESDEIQGDARMNERNDSNEWLRPTDQTHIHTFCPLIGFHAHFFTQYYSFSARLNGMNVTMLANNKKL